MPFFIKRDGQQSASHDRFEPAVSGAQQLFKFASETGADATYSVFSEEGKLLASVTNRRITGRFTKQVWGGRKGDDAIFVGTEEFDATNHVLLMSHDSLLKLQDGDESSDDIGRAHVDWEGNPCEVSIVDSIREYFGVGDLEDIAPEALAFARKAANAEPLPEQWLTLSVQVQLQVAPGADVDAFVKDMNFSVSSNTPGIRVLAMSERPALVQAD